MMRFIEKPNLPAGKARMVICGELCSELISFLRSREIEPVFISPNSSIDPATANHADMAALHLGTDNIIVDGNQTSLIDKLRSIGFDVTPTANVIVGEYPCDCALNFTVVSNYIIGRFSSADSNLLEKAERYTKLDLKQGYCKCSCLVLNEKALITDDTTIHKKCLENGFDCLLIAKGDVSLPGHEYGFIGGASAKISESEVLFFGDITKHRDYKKIADFIEKYGCEIISLDFPLTDFGGMIPIIEETP